jgi:hypothetical protein
MNIHTALPHDNPEIDHGPHDERHAVASIERPAMTRVAIGVIEINCGDALALSGAVHQRPTIVLSHFE